LQAKQLVKDEQRKHSFGQAMHFLEERSGNHPIKQKSLQELSSLRKLLRVQDVQFVIEIQMLQVEEQA
jgi:hypothetical protein